MIDGSVVVAGHGGFRRGLGRAGRVLRRTGYAAVAVAVLLVSGLLPFQTIRVPSDSMTPTVFPGDHLLLDKLGKTRSNAEFLNSMSA